MVGPQGPRGRPGHPGLPGEVGANGPPGLRGCPGLQGQNSNPEPSGQACYVVIHGVPSALRVTLDQELVDKVIMTTRTKMMYVDNHVTTYKLRSNHHEDIRGLH